MIRNLKNSPKVPFDLDAFILHSREKLELVHLLLKPTENLKEHKNPFDVIFFVVEGAGILTIEDESFILNENDVVEVSSDKNRAWKNNTNKNLRLLVIKLIS